MTYLSSFATVGKAKLIADEVIVDAATNIHIFPDGRPLPNRDGWSIVLFQIKANPVEPFAMIFRKFRITMTARIIYRTRTVPYDKLDGVYTDMLDTADRVALSWDRSGSFKSDFVELLNSANREGMAGDIIHVDQDAEPIERDAEFFRLEQDDSILPVGFSLDLFFSSGPIAIQRSCG